MHISANVLPISPECWRKSLKMRTIQRSGFDEKMARYES
ncbi:hypothetical protein CW298_0912 [Salmonella enterica subsp. enterica serovar Muenchen]|uniref:Uncharacterized protein n=11 Tax=Salmonella enterica I TaxID=59201 RepID=A0A0N1QU60_SALSV|nr:hypothetical protein SPAB_03948 [Salmonella enterica subsp. enterica serovar Paratyphi B str. SPB7]ACF61805.1 hypothetical protein SNSL254_A3418 [Salmonella enterica subsp. enterica serovar Newport str. SL254]ACF66973.1 hypothetical protein SeHA_C3412 [Salmonella enterica subsp. enterica serovar Heidelberg str. SL476]ACF89630.1 hypothetical protein SeSA_A3347 [Salmonella enterica subsp. enterica serovar Schwarzengrund str. CVM19633]ACH50674.1 hypothetical protein SeAg_B3338 [Salmonella enter